MLLTPAFPQFEYRLPNFPPDEYGFTTADRLRWGTYGINYLLNDSDVSYLGALKFEDGSPLFSDRELSHMHDVKGVTQGFLRAWYAVLAVLLLLGGLGLAGALGMGFPCGCEAWRQADAAAGAGGGSHRNGWGQRLR